MGRSPKETVAAPPDTSRLEALGERVFAAVIGMVEVASIHIGGRLGLYRALADGGDANSGELAVRTGTAGAIHS